MVVIKRVIREYGAVRCHKEIACARGTRQRERSVQSGHGGMVGGIISQQAASLQSSGASKPSSQCTLWKVGSRWIHFKESPKHPCNELMG